MMYSSDVTSRSPIEEVYIRLQHVKVSAVNPNFHHEFDKLKGDNEKGDLDSCLVRWGLSLILPGETMLFPLDVAKDGPRKYGSLCDACNCGYGL